MNCDKTVRKAKEPLIFSYYSTVLYINTLLGSWSPKRKDAFLFFLFLNSLLFSLGFFKKLFFLGIQLLKPLMWYTYSIRYHRLQGPCRIVVYIFYISLDSLLVDSSCSHCENSNHPLSSWASYNILIVEYREVTAQFVYFPIFNLPLFILMP